MVELKNEDISPTPPVPRGGVQEAWRAMYQAELPLPYLRRSCGVHEIRYGLLCDYHRHATWLH